MKAILLTINQYKENDCVINAISETESFSFLARGILNPKGKNHAINNILTIADLEFHEGKYKHPVLNYSSVISNPMKEDQDIDYLNALNLIDEVTIKLLEESERYKAFKYLEGALHSLKKQTTPWATLLVYLTKIFAISGYGFEANQCVMCGSKHDIVTFSFVDGGFICQDCYRAEMKSKFTHKQLVLLRYVINKEEYSELERITTPIDDQLDLLNKFFEFIFDNYGVSLKSKDLILK